VAISDRVVRAAICAAWLLAGQRALAQTGTGPAAQAPEQGALLRLLDAEGRALDPGRDALGISRRITHDSSLPRAPSEGEKSIDPDNFRVELSDPRERRDVVYVQLAALDPTGARHGLLRHVPLRRLLGSTRFRSPFIRLVSDATDASAPDVGLQLLRVNLRDRVVVSVGCCDQGLSTELRVGREGGGQAARDALRGRLRVLVLRAARGSAPVLGENDAQALELARRQVEIANEIWGQCFIDFGPPEAAEVSVVDPPEPALLAISDLDGLPARGDGAIVFRARGKRIGPIALRRGALPEQTAAEIARVLRAQHFVPEISVNPRADHAAQRGADVLVRDAQGALVALSVDPEQPLSSDTQQRVSIGSVDLSDGVSEFDNTISAVGTLEERSLVKLLADGDPTSIEVLLVNRFVNRDRQGEAFIEADGSSMANTLIFDRNAVRYERQAWVQAHELGHVLLDEPFHPDNLGPDRPWLLMDADARQGRVLGPKRLTAEECEKARRRSGPDAHPPLLKPVSR
jgi:hypothetical protein